MDGRNYNDILKFNEHLTVGTPCLVRWTNNFCYYEGEGEVAKVNAKSIRVRLTKHVPSKLDPTYEGYKVGREIVAPHTAAYKLWSWNNGVFPREDTSETI